MNSFTGKELIELLTNGVNQSGNENIVIDHISATSKAIFTTLTFVASNRTDKQKLYDDCKGGIIICDKTIVIDESKCFNIIVDDPKLTFSIIANKLFVPAIKYKIHPSAIISEGAKISENVYIGPNCIIGNCVIGEGSILYGNIMLYDNVTLGKGVVINANCSIGAEGFGFNKDEAGIPIQFPHIGGVIIEDNVHVGANTCIDRGALGDTILKKGCKIDNLVHIAHNVHIGENVYVIANAMIGGSTIINTGAYIAPSASLRDGITIGINSLVGMGAVVTKSIPNHEIWMGNPAIFFKNILK
jgi:UDP-3-O-[3-hydroxymyristoyl] glucosamine N-acyltransferase